LTFAVSQVDAMYFDLSNVFDLVLHYLLMHKLNSFGYSDGYIRWLRSYLTNRGFHVRVSGTFSLLLQVTSGVQQSSV
jgi:hypothetical protein